MRKKIYCSRTSSLSEEVKIDKDVVAAVLRGTCETLSTSRFYKSVLTESAPDTLLSRIWKVFLRPNSDLAPVVGGASCSDRLSIDQLHLSDNTNVTGQVVELCLLLCRPFGSNGLDLAVSVFLKSKMVKIK